MAHGEALAVAGNQRWRAENLGPGLIIKIRRQAMDQNEWQRVEELLQQTLDLDSSKRRAFLDQACGMDSALRQQVEALLEKEETAKSFIETPAVARLAQSLANTAKQHLIGRQISHYRI